jgi:hypothetical protein
LTAVQTFIKHGFWTDRVESHDRAIRVYSQIKFWLVIARVDQQGVFGMQVIAKSLRRSAFAHHWKAGCLGCDALPAGQVQIVPLIGQPPVAVFKDLAIQSNRVTDGPKMIYQ